MSISYGETPSPWATTPTGARKVGWPLIVAGIAEVIGAFIGRDQMAGLLLGGVALIIGLLVWRLMLYAPKLGPSMLAGAAMPVGALAAVVGFVGFGTLPQEVIPVLQGLALVIAVVAPLAVRRFGWTLMALGAAGATRMFAFAEQYVLGALQGASPADAAFGGLGGGLLAIACGLGVHVQRSAERGTPLGADGAAPDADG